MAVDIQIRPAVLTRKLLAKLCTSQSSQSHSLSSPGRRQSLDLEFSVQSQQASIDTWFTWLPWSMFKSFLNTCHTCLITLLDTWQGWKWLQRCSKLNVSWTHTRQKLHSPSPFVAQVPTKASRKAAKALWNVEHCLAFHSFPSDLVTFSRLPEGVKTVLPLWCRLWWATERNSGDGKFWERREWLQPMHLPGAFRS